jgi:hypothetical protein
MTELDLSIIIDEYKDLEATDEMIDTLLQYLVDAIDYGILDITYDELISNIQAQRTLRISNN